MELPRGSAQKVAVVALRQPSLWIALMARALPGESNYEMAFLVNMMGR
jgi:hypothetical protein